MSVVVIVLGCHKYMDYLHAQIQRLRSMLPYEIIGYVGSPSSACAFFDASTHILTLPCEDDYDHHPAKTQAAFQWVHENRPGLRGVLKTDDDIRFSDLSEVARVLESSAHIHFGGAVVDKCEAGPVGAHRREQKYTHPDRVPHHQKSHYCFGWAYYVSALSLTHIANAASTYKSSPLEDVCTGFVLNQHNIFPVPMNIQCEEIHRNEEWLTWKYN